MGNCYEKLAVLSGSDDINKKLLSGVELRNEIKTKI